jgi:hypothetical protein
MPYPGSFASFFENSYYIDKYHQLSPFLEPTNYTHLLFACSSMAEMRYLVKQEEPFNKDRSGVCPMFFSPQGIACRFPGWLVCVQPALFFSAAEDRQNHFTARPIEERDKDPRVFPLCTHCWRLLPLPLKCLTGACAKAAASA